MRDRNLLTQVLIANLLVIVAAVIASLVAVNPNIDLEAKPQAAIVLGLAVSVTILVNVLMLKRRFRPLERLVDEMERADLSRPGANITDRDISGPEEVQRLHNAFRRMLERLEAERRRASSVALAAQEEERARVARDLHDEVNQSLTGLLLRLEAARKRSTPELAHELAETKALANQAMQELLTLARALRPTALDDLGLRAALSTLVAELGRKGGVETSFAGNGELTDVPMDVQLVTYRVAQEALSNATQHAEAESITVRADRERGIVRLTVEDDGDGFTFDQATRGLGLGGMRERALLVGGELAVESRPGAGTRISLEVPIGEGGESGNHLRDAALRDWRGLPSPPGTVPNPSPWR
jgi:two-component system sensor histidine kinase UhpB